MASWGLHHFTSTWTDSLKRLLLCVTQSSLLWSHDHCFHGRRCRGEADQYGLGHLALAVLLRSGKRNEIKDTTGLKNIWNISRTWGIFYQDVCRFSFQIYFFPTKPTIFPLASSQVPKVLVGYLLKAPRKADLWSSSLILPNQIFWFWSDVTNFRDQIQIRKNKNLQFDMNEKYLIWKFIQHWMNCTSLDI